MCLFSRPVVPNNDLTTTIRGWGRLGGEVNTNTPGAGKHARPARRGLGRLFTQPGEVIGTGVAFAALYWWGVLGNVPLWALLTILFVSGLMSTVIARGLGDRTSTVGIHARMALAAANTGAVIYATGWGP